MAAIKFETVFEHLPDCQILLDKEYIILAATNSYLDATQTTREQIVGHYIFESFPENSDMQTSTRMILAALDGLKTTGKPFQLDTVKYDLKDSKTGQFCPRYWILSGTGVPDEEKPDLILYRARDITRETIHQQRMEEKLKAVEIFKLLVDNVRDYAIFMLDTEGIIRTWNKGAKRMQLYEDAEVIGKHFSLFHTQQDIIFEKPTKELEQALKSGTFEEEDWRIRKDGSKFWANVIITPVWDNQRKHIGFAKVIRDLTERRKAEERVIAAYEDSSRLKSEFLANMSHEIRTPMNGVLTAATLLADLKLVNMEQRELLNIISESGQSLLKIINDILDYSKIEAREVILTSVPFCVPETLEKVISLYRVTALHDRQLRIELSTAGQCQAQVIGDQLRFHQIALNLVDNAVKFTEQGLIKVHLAILSSPEDSKLADIQLDISDTGIGMNDDTLGKLFKPFSQGDTSSRKRYKGTGLGLSICRQLVELMHGEMSVKSCPGHGSVFTLRLRLPFARIAATLEQKPVSAPIAPLKPNMKILVAEDNPINRTVALKVLRKLGYSQVDLAVDGKECVEKFEESKYDVILMDVMMPRMDGLEATKLIRSSGSNIPIIAMTANALKGDDDTCLKAGMNSYMAKPLDIRSLAVKLNEIHGIHENNEIQEIQETSANNQKLLPPQ